MCHLDTIKKTATKILIYFKRLKLKSLVQEIMFKYLKKKTL